MSHRVDIDKLLHGLPVLFRSGHTTISINDLYALCEELAELRWEVRRFPAKQEMLAREFWERGRDAAWRTKR